MSKEIATSPAKTDALSAMLGFKTISISELDEEQKKVLKDTVAKDTTDTELAYFLNVAMAQELNPFTKEVWAIKYRDRLVITTSRDGYLKIAKRDQMFDSIQSAEVREGDEFRIDPISGQIEHCFTAKRGAILGAWAMITRKDGKKIAKYVSLSEYQGTTEPWKKYTSAMICKCAETALCKQFANITGVMAEELMPREGIDHGTDSSPAAVEEQESLKDRLLDKIMACETQEQFDALKQEIAGVAGKLFEKERKEVFEAAKAKGADLAVIDVVPIDDRPKSEEPKSKPKTTKKDEPEQASIPMTEVDLETAEREGMKAA